MKSSKAKIIRIRIIENDRRIPKYHKVRCVHETRPAEKQVTKIIIVKNFNIDSRQGESK